MLTITGQSQIPDYPRCSVLSRMVRGGSLRVESSIPAQFCYIAGHTGAVPNQVRAACVAFDIPTCVQLGGFWA